ncbi:hypothetical protein PCANC_28588 [Puccinia coronata f. sp. avenae]|uniref:Uncharacterized protein n=1 Tax=Puccinia coronata f. sp. avenae TaxID=200324 RepID=A0A2N5RXH9_9BASI|nr:hypothetical protein PCANC_28588 [Puccinia coronata f. sp. avenae]
MAANSKKRCKQSESQAPDTSESDRAAQSQEQTGRQTKRPSRTVVIDNSDDEQQVSNDAKSQDLSDKQELKRALKVHQNQVSSFYAL